MYVSRGVSRKEWMWRGLAIAMCLAMVGLAVMPLAPLAVGDIAAYYAGTGGNSLSILWSCFYKCWPSEIN